jgi:hypothetical protein
MPLIAPNSTDVSLFFKLVDPASGVPETGLVIANLSACYVRDGADHSVSTALTALATVTTAHTDNYAIQIDTTACPGLTRVDFPDAAFLSGVGRVQCIVTGAAIDPAVIEVELVPWLTPITGATTRSVNAADAALSTYAGGDTAGTTTLLGKFVGITLLAQWLGALAGKQAPNATAQTEIRATGAGAGTFDATTDSTEAVRDYTGTSTYAGGAVASVTGNVGGNVTGSVGSVTGLTTTTIAAAVWAHATAVALVASVAALPAAVWTYVTRTITQTAPQAAAAISGGPVTTYRGTTWSQTLTIADITGWTKILVAVKDNSEDADTASIVYWQKSTAGTGDGLIYANGATATAGNGSITVNSSTSITLALAASVAATIPPKYGRLYGIKAFDAAGVDQVSIGGEWHVCSDIPKATT